MKYRSLLTAQQLELLISRCVSPRQELPVESECESPSCLQQCISAGCIECWVDPVIETLAKALGCRLFLDGMRTHINLSRQPFTNHRLLWIVLVAVYFIAFWLFLWMTDEKRVVIAKQIEVTQRIEGQKAAVAAAIEEQERRKREQQKIVLTEQQAMQLASARQLIQRKVFSWNKMIGDIEEYVPKNARIMSIKVEEIVNTTDEVMARVQVKALGTTPDELTAMMGNLEKSGGLFIVGETGQEAPAESGETPFTINLVYKPSRGGAQ